MCLFLAPRFAHVDVHGIVQAICLCALFALTCNSLPVDPSVVEASLDEGIKNTLVVKASTRCCITVPNNSPFCITDRKLLRHSLYDPIALMVTLSFSADCPPVQPRTFLLRAHYLGGLGSCIPVPASASVRVGGLCVPRLSDHRAHDPMRALLHGHVARNRPVEHRYRYGMKAAISSTVSYRWSAYWHLFFMKQ